MKMIKKNKNKIHLNFQKKLKNNQIRKEIISYNYFINLKIKNKNNQIRNLMIILINFKQYFLFLKRNSKKFHNFI